MMKPFLIENLYKETENFVISDNFVPNNMRNEDESSNFWNYIKSHHNELFKKCNYSKMYIDLCKEVEKYIPKNTFTVTAFYHAKNFRTIKMEVHDNSGIYGNREFVFQIPFIDWKTSFKETKIK